MSAQATAPSAADTRPLPTPTVTAPAAAPAAGKRTRAAAPAPADTRRLPTPTFDDPSNPLHQLSAKEIFGARFSAGVVILKYPLRTPRIRHLYQRDFVNLSQMMHALDRYRSVRRVDVAALDKAEANIGARLAALRTFFQSKSREANALLSTNQASDMEIQYPAATICHAPIISPHAREYMEALQLADDAYSKLHICHLLGLISSKDKFAAERTYAKTMQSLGAAVRTERLAMLSAVRSLRVSAETADDAAQIDDLTGSEATALAAQASDPNTTLGTVSQEQEAARIAAEVHDSSARHAAKEATAAAQRSSAADEAALTPAAGPAGVTA